VQVKTMECNCGAPLEPLFQFWAVTICSKRCGAEAGKGDSNTFIWIGTGPIRDIIIQENVTYGLFLNTDEARMFIRRKWNNPYVRLVQFTGLIKTIKGYYDWGEHSVTLTVLRECVLKPVGKSFVLKSF
jgi:hypothetical protein